MFKPIAIAEAELSSLTGIRVDARYEECRVLIRSQNRPVAWVQVSLQAGCISAEELQQQVIRQRGPEVLHYCMQQKQMIAEDGDYPGISVVVCTRNRAASLSNCLTHLLNLDYPQYEIIVVDNAPDDEQTRELSAGLPVQYVREPVAGLDRARNRGIAEARYPLVAFTDDDVKVDPHWLKALAESFEDPAVMAVTGLVAPACLDTRAEQLFELVYGGMGKGFSRRYWHRTRVSAGRVLWSSGMGVGANMAFRKQVFESIGGFDPALDVGTPTRGGGDIEMFHRVVSSGFLLAYDPAVLVWHQHRTQAGALLRQIRDNGSGFATYLFTVLLQGRVDVFTWMRFFFINWMGRWLVGNLLRRRRRIPLRFVLAEVLGLLKSPYLLFVSRRRHSKPVVKKPALSPGIPVAVPGTPPVNG